MKHFSLSIWLCLFLIAEASAQNFSPDFNLSDTTQIHVLETKKGDRFIGRVVKIEQTTLSFAFRADQELLFEFNELERVFVYNSTLKSASFRPTYLSVFPTAYNYQQGEWEYQNVDLLWNTLNYGVSDNFSVGGGFFIPLAFLARLKLTQPLSDKVHLAANLQTVVPLVEDAFPFSVLTFIGSIGEPDRLLNIGLGYGFTWDASESSVFLTSLGGNVRFSDRIGVNGSLDLGISDEDVFIFPSIAMNYFGKQNRLSLGFVLDPALDALGLLGLPLVSYNQRF